MDNRKTAALFAGTTLLLALLALKGIFSGSVAIPFRQALAVLAGRERGSPAAAILIGVRAPRVVMAILAGMMLASGGTISQAVFRNPLADPYIIGISSGAVSGASLAFILGLSDIWFGLFAFCGAILAAALIFRIAGSGARADTSSLLIVGVALSAFLSALSSFIMYVAGQDAYRVMLWTMGYLGTATWLRVALMAAPLGGALLYFAWRRHDVDALLLGDEEAHSLGLPVGKLKRRLLLVVSLTAAFSVAFTGMIGFVGLIVPHGVRLCVGNSHGRLLPLACWTGGAFLLLADTLARTLLSPMEIPIGVITALFGAPFFLFLALRGGKERYGGA
ncbi:MAG: iron ABC transporter permease [Treponema sp.]|jgi:iron complex transport system permease protein|nr:iron ABC transporter permease [Treponema sp.]